jgi:hypothetical protein
MSTVVVERSFDQPVAFEDIQAIEERGAWCLEAHGVRFERTYFSGDRRRMICVYEAPDAESVRLAQRRAGMPFGPVWPAHLVRHGIGEADGDTIVVERVFPQPVDEPGLRAAAANASWCLGTWGARLELSYLSPDGHRCLCVFTAADAEAVRQAQKTSGLPFEAAWPATVHEPPATP